MIDSVDGVGAMGDASAKPIADVEIGDEVLSSDAKTGEVSVELVTALPRTGDENNKLDRDMVDVSVDTDADGEVDGTIETTAGHEFWTNLTEPSNDGAKWVPARDLASSAWLRTSSGTWVQSVVVKSETRLVNTYNLTVANTHTYFIHTATTDVLVHNCTWNISTVDFHFDKHVDGIGKKNKIPDMPEYKNDFEKYVSDGVKFMCTCSGSAGAGVLQATRMDGTVIRFNTVEGWFGVVDNNVIETFYRPDRGVDYFHDEATK